jgi:hypothetical protein
MGILPMFFVSRASPTSSLSPHTASGSPNFAPDPLASSGKQWRHLVRRSRGKGDEVGSSAMRSDGGWPVFMGQEAHATTSSNDLTPSAVPAQRDATISGLSTENKR